MPSTTTRTCLLFGWVVLAGCTTTIEGTGGGEGDDADAKASSGSSGSRGSSGAYSTDAGETPTRPPPVITSVSPLAGAYGTVVTITGDNLDEASAVLSLDTPTEPLELRSPATTGTGTTGTTTSTGAAIVVSWSKTEISFKYPFPAEGAMRVKTRSGSAEGGTFEPSWRPGSPLSGVYSRREYLAAVAPSSGRLVALFDGATGPKVVVVEPDGTVRAKPFARGATLLLQASLYVNASGGVDGLFAAGDKLWTMTDAAGVGSTSSTSIAAKRAAGGRDGTGPYAWIDGGGGTITRVRAPSWTSTGESIADPATASAPGKSIGVGIEHSLYVGWGVHSTGSFPTYDHTARPVARRLRPGQTTFDAQRSIGGSVDDYMAWTRLLGGPDGRLWSYYCGNDSGLFTGASWDCGEGYVGGGGAPGAAFQEHVVGWNETTSFATMCETSTNQLRVGPEGDTAKQETILFPCPHVAAVAVDPSGAGQFVVWSGKYLYAPKKR